MALQPAYGGGRVGATPGSIPAEALADGVVPSGVRRAALFGGGMGSGAYGVFTWTLTGTPSWRVTWKASLSGSWIYSRVWGTTGANIPAVGVSATGQIILQRAGLTELISAAGAYLADGAPHEYSVEGNSTTVSISRDGEVIASGASAGAWAAGNTRYIGAYATGQLNRPEILWDFRFEDRNSAANTATFPLDGDFQNTEPGSTVADATVTGDVDWVTVLGESTKPMLAVPYQGVATGVRRGARFDGTAGKVALTTWAPTSTSCVYEFTFAPGDVQSVGGGQAVGRAAVGFADVRFNTDMSVQLILGASALLTVANGYKNSEPPARWRAEVTATTATLIKNGVVVGFATGLTNSLVTTPGTLYLGASSASTRPINGTLYDVRLIDPASAANTAYFPLDGLDSSGNFPNEHPGSSVADATVTGLVQFATVLSSDGGRALPVGRAVYLHGARFPGNQAVAGATFRPQVDTVVVDESGSINTLSDDLFTAPAAGVVDVTGAFTVPANADPADTLSVRVVVGATILSEVYVEGGNPTQAVAVPFQAVGAVAAGDNVQVLIVGVLGTTTFNLQNFTIALRFYPTAP